VDTDDIKNMTREDAKKVYKTQWWDKYGYGAFPDTVSFKLLDLSVNMGHIQAHKLLQRAINNCDGKKIVVDGVIGEATVAAAHACPDDILLSEFRRAAVEFYLTILAKNPKCLKYKKGWMRRGFA
jgi:lysozyme family protein